MEDANSGKSGPSSGFFRGEEPNFRGEEPLVEPKAPPRENVDQPLKPPPFGLNNSGQPEEFFSSRELAWKFFSPKKKFKGTYLESGRGKMCLIYMYIYT
jgi:hypothetical protein